jgi:hypothetical protein
VVFSGDLQAEERAIFRALSAAGQFQHTDAVLLGAFCRAAAIERQAAGLIKADLATVAPSVLKAFTEATRAMAALAEPLMLCPRAYVAWTSAQAASGRRACRACGACVIGYSRERRG